MALDPANYIDELSITDPTASDLVSQGDDQIRTVKRAVKQSFPSVDIAVNAIHTSSSAPAVSVAEGLVWIDTSAGAGNHVAKIYDGSSFITLPFSVETAQKVDVNDGTIDGTVIGGASAAAITGTTIKADTSLELATGATVTGIDNATLATGSATLIPTQGAVKTYVDAQVTAQDLDITTDSGTIDIDLDGDTLTVAGGAGLDTAASSTTVTVNVTDGGVTNAKLADMAANTVKVRNASSSGVPSDLAVATTQIVIGDGTGFTAASLSGDATMANTGAVSVTGIQGQAVSSTAATNDQYLKYSASSSEWQKVDVLAPDRLTTKGDLLVYNTVDSETRLPVGTNDYSLLADSSATNGVAWKQIPTATIADDAVTYGKMQDLGTANRVIGGTATGTLAEVQIVDAMVNASAAIDATKIANGSVTSTEFQYINGLTSDAQTQINAKGVGDAVLANDQSWTGSQRATAVTDNDMSYDMNGGQNFISTPSGDATLTFTNIANGQSGFLKLINSGGHTISLHSNSKADANLATTVSTAGTYLLSYFSDGTDVWLTNSAIYA